MRKSNRLNSPSMPFPPFLGLKMVGLRGVLFVFLILFALLQTYPASAISPTPTSTPLPNQQLSDQLKTATDTFTAKNYSSALEQFNQALPLARQLKDRQSEAYCLYFIGAADFYLEDYPGALQAYQASQPIWHELGDNLWESILWNGIALVYAHQQAYDQAIQANLKLLDLTVILNDTKRQAQTLFSIALEYDLMSDYPNAITYYHQLLALYQKNGDQAGQAKALYSLGVDQSYLMQYDQSLKSLQGALGFYQNLGDQAGEMLTYSQMGVELYLQGSYPESRQAYQQALSLAQTQGDQANQLECTIAIGLNNIRTGDYVTGIKDYNDALALAQQLGDKGTQGTILNNLGLVYHYYLGQLDQALPYYQQALALANELDDAGLEGLVLTNLATAYMDQNDLEKALSSYQDALAALQKTSSQHGIGVTLADIGLVYQRMGQPDQALTFDQQGLEKDRQAGDRREEADVLSNIGLVYLDKGDLDQALASEQQALTIQQDLDDRASEWSTLHAIGYLLKQKGSIDEAIKYYKQAVDIAESVQQQAKVEEFKTAIASSQAPVYEELIQLLWEQGSYDEAFAYTERARARAFLDQLANGKLDLRAGVPAQLLARERELRSQITAEREALISLKNGPSSSRDTSGLTAASDHLSTLESDYNALLTQMKIASPETASLVSVNPASLAQIQASLSGQVTLVEYFITEDHTYIFIITHQDFKRVAVEVKRTDLEDAITSFRNFADLTDPYPESLKKLYAWLIVPIKADLKTSVIGIIPHGNLHYLPFTALTDGKSYLGATYTLFTLPDASSLLFLHPKTLKGPPTLLALGNPATSEPLPDLHFASDEVSQIASLFKTNALVGAQASKTTFEAQASQSTYIHLAAHGQYNPRNPLFSTIFLAGSSQDDGRLEAHEIYSLDLTNQTDLVVLSACQTEIGKITGGDEVIGLTRAFLYAGAPTVIASLWNVDDAATSLLMVRFYQHLLNGSSKAEALRQAQADVRQKYPNPYYWAAFVLTGDPGSNKNAPMGLPGINSSNIKQVAYYAYFTIVLLMAASTLIGIWVWWRKSEH